MTRFALAALGRKKENPGFTARLDEKRDSGRGTDAYTPFPGEYVRMIVSRKRLKR
jgi:hypothetical protein